MADITPRLDNPKDTHCSSCQAVVAKSVGTLESGSTKIRKLIELVDDIEQRNDGTEKVIIFSQFTMTLRLIQGILNEGTSSSCNVSGPFAVVRVLAKQPAQMMTR